MRTRNPTMSKSSSWPKAKTVVRKWLNLNDSEFHSDCCINESLGLAQQQEMRRRRSCSDTATATDGSLLTRTHDLSDGWQVESSDDTLRPQYLPRPRYGSPAPTSTWRPPKELRMFVGTWNVGGRAPHGELDLSDWLMDDDGPGSSSPHIYVLGFQEIVPLNAGNVLGAEDKGPARKWLDLIRRALNHHPPSSAASSSSPPSRSSRSNCSPSDSLHHKGGRVSFSDLLAAEDRDDSCRPSTASEPDDDNDTSTPESSSEEEPLSLSAGQRRHRHRHGGASSPYHPSYRLAASKQMVGILLCVWVRADVLPCVAGVRASCVGRGVMGYMGNKGSVSVSLALRGGAALCFVCTHLASGDRDVDGARRNSDVAEILRRTRFATPPARRNVPCHASPPATILEHDKVIWLGDLNYRLLAGGGEGGREGDTRLLVERNEWAALLERDQLRAEQKAGRVFAGWEEGRIGFPPTYKYAADSDAYAMTLVESSAAAGSREKKRTPAWCDRILWRGEGMEQHWYARGESRFSDHRPVGALFTARLGGGGGTVNNAVPPNCRVADAAARGNATVEAEEIMLVLAPRACCFPTPPPPPLAHSSRF